MSKAISKVGGAISPYNQIDKVGSMFGKAVDSVGGKVSYDNSAYNQLNQFLNNYDTSATDATVSALQNYAKSASQNLSNLPNYNFSVDASDQARQRAEDATYKSYMDRLNPQFERQTSDLATALANKGLAVGSEAYERAMSDLQQKQNDAASQAAYQATLAGQDAYSKSLADQISAGTFGNQAQQSYIAQILSALADSPTSYDIAMDKFSAGSANAANQYNAQVQRAQNRLGVLNSLLGAGAKIAGGQQ